MQDLSESHWRIWGARHTNQLLLSPLGEARHWDPFPDLMALGQKQALWQKTVLNLPTSFSESGSAFTQHGAFNQSLFPTKGIYELLLNQGLRCEGGSRASCSTNLLMSFHFFPNIYIFKYFKNGLFKLKK